MYKFDTNKLFTVNEEAQFSAARSKKRCTKTCKSRLKVVLLITFKKNDHDEIKQEKTSMYHNTKTTSRFEFGISRNPTAKKAGSNVVTIATLPAASQQYSVGTTQISMTVKEATALQSFLNESLSESAVSTESPSIDV